MSAPERIVRFNQVGYDSGMTPAHNGAWVSWTEHDAAVEALRAERDALAARAEKLEWALRKIAEMPAHHAGQTRNEYHMQEIARAALSTQEGDGAPPSA